MRDLGIHPETVSGSAARELHFKSAMGRHYHLQLLLLLFVSGSVLIMVLLHLTKENSATELWERDRNSNLCWVRITSATAKEAESVHH